MNKAAISLATVFLTGIFLLGLFGVLAFLDEFARLPFYNSLPIAAGVVDGTLLILRWRHKTENKLVVQMRAGLRFARKIVRHERPAIIDDFQSKLRPDRPVMNVQTR